MSFKVCPETLGTILGDHSDQTISWDIHYFWDFAHIETSNTTLGDLGLCTLVHRALPYRDTTLVYMALRYRKVLWNVRYFLETSDTAICWEIGNYTRTLPTCDARSKGQSTKIGVYFRVFLGGFLSDQILVVSNSAEILQIDLWNEHHVYKTLLREDCWALFWWFDFVNGMGHVFPKW